MTLSKKNSAFLLFYSLNFGIKKKSQGVYVYKKVFLKFIYFVILFRFLKEIIEKIWIFIVLLFQFFVKFLQYEIIISLFKKKFSTKNLKDFDENLFLLYTGKFFSIFFYFKWKNKLRPVRPH